ncbi:hypothetical protein N7481_009489 [Penicillium waksmanii]|uniref:uncharacterized protein n=1 Tax=Penicillium waksmanii TaxID=69791 RepID=UPI002548E7B9|nr:uncharacterized protein N7481_009489 [Penicillium waksmanii]KAJ5975782.1 hypothetical protein N7481_009489 [Penicillium waksmanii]
MTELTTTTPPAPAAASASAVPKHHAGPDANLSIRVQQKAEHEHRKDKQSLKGNATKPKLRLHAEELRHPSSVSFFTLVPDVNSKLDTALDNIIRYLYTSPATKSEDIERSNKRIWPSFNPSVPPTRSVTLFLRDFSGVAYTTGTELDNDHKEIHLSLPYIKHCTTLADPVRELTGVLTHELVHCYQHTAPPKTDDEPETKIPHPPGGLIEGIADFVRLKAHLDPPHWKKPQSASERASKWDAGYQHTAYFLAWIEDVWVGEGAIGMLNDRLLRVGYVGEDKEKSLAGEIGFWRGLFGMEVAELWGKYGQFLDGDGGK